MAERRMISKKVVFEDDFITLSDKSKSLYFTLLLEADDDGLLKNVKQVLATAGANVRSLEALRDKGFIILFKSGVAVIRHWKIHNLVPKDKII